jgi:outer membrane protein OmpA-like peptidoglycan-associated protein
MKRVTLIIGMFLAGTTAGWTQTYEIQQPKGVWQTPGDIPQPKGHWQIPGEIQQPKGPWQRPGDIEVPKGIQAVHLADTKCEHRLELVADALFDFDKSSLRSDAEETLRAVAPDLAKAGKHPVTVEGHTDAVGTQAYNLTLSENRARSVRDWLAAQGYVPADTAIEGYGKLRPVAPNTFPDGLDNPAGRQKNRRVDIVINTCG